MTLRCYTSTRRSYKIYHGHDVEPRAFGMPTEIYQDVDFVEPDALHHLFCLLAGYYHPLIRQLFQGLPDQVSSKKMDASSRRSGVHALHHHLCLGIRFCLELITRDVNVFPVVSCRVMWVNLHERMYIRK